MYTVQELRNIDEKELHEELKKARIELHKLRMSAKTKQLKASHKLKNIKKYIAQLMTLLNSGKKSPKQLTTDEQEKNDKETKEVKKSSTKKATKKTKKS